MSGTNCSLARHNPLSGANLRLRDELPAPVTVREPNLRRAEPRPVTICAGPALSRVHAAADVWASVAEVLGPPGVTWMSVTVKSCLRQQIKRVRGPVAAVPGEDRRRPSRSATVACDHNHLRLIKVRTPPQRCSTTSAFRPVMLS